MEAIPKKRKRITDFDNGRVIEGFLQGKTGTQLEKELGIPRTTLYGKWKKYQQEGNLAKKPKSGRPKITTRREDVMMLREVKKNPFISCKQIGIAIDRPDLSVQTIRRRLNKVWGLISCRAADKPLLTRRNRIKRLRWALAHRNWTPDQWRSVLWSDESKFLIRYHAARRVWRLPGQRYLPKNTNKTVKHDKKVMVWGCFCYGGVGKLFRINGIMRKEDYHSILMRQMIPSADTLFPGIPFIFQQDNDPKHTANICKAYLVNKAINTLDWPAQSPDLNPIENLWNQLDRNLKDRVCNTEDQLFDILKAGWEALPQDYLQKLVDSMPSRCRAVIKARGHGTKY
jgi:transposase